METNFQQNNPPLSNPTELPIKPNSTVKAKIIVSVIYVVVLYFGLNLFWFAGLNLLLGLPYFGLLLANSAFAIVDLYFRDRFSTGYIYIVYIILISLMYIAGNFASNNANKSLFPEILQAQFAVFLVGLLPFVVSFIYKFFKFKKSAAQVSDAPVKQPIQANFTNSFRQLGTKNFYGQHKILTALLLFILLILGGIKIAAGGAAVFSCGLTTMNAFSALDQTNVLNCSGEVGTKAVSPLVCSVFFANSDAKNYCLNRYSVENNKPDICKSQPDNFTFQQLSCAQDLAIKNKDIKLCDSLSASRDLCRNAVRHQLFYSGANGNAYATLQGTSDPCPGDDPSFWLDGYESVCTARKNAVFASCKNEKDANKIPDCYLNIALEQQNPELCQAIDSNDYQSTQCYFKIAEAANNISYCNLLPGEDPATGILPRATCYRTILGLPQGTMDNSTAACATITDFNNRNNCHALLSYLTAYYGMLSLQPDQRTEAMFTKIRESAVRKCEAVTDGKLKEWCQTTVGNYILHSPASAEPNNFPGIATTTTASAQFTNKP